MFRKVSNAVSAVKSALSRRKTRPEEQEFVAMSFQARLGAKLKVPVMCVSADELPAKLSFEDINWAGFGLFGCVYIVRVGTEAKKVLKEVCGVESQTLAQISDPEHGPVAMKVLGIISNQPSRLDSFLHEAEVLRGLEHPHIVAHFASFILEGKIENDWHTLWLAQPPVSLRTPGNPAYGVILMERLGVDVRTIMHKLHLLNLNEDELVHILRDIGSALVYLHSKDITHNDLHQGNIVSTVLDQEFDRARIFSHPFKLIDFGLSTRCRPDESWLHQEADIISSKALANWSDESKFARSWINQPNDFILMNPYLRDSFYLGILLMKLSIPNGLFENHRRLDMLETFHEESWVRKASLRKALMLMGTPDEWGRITVEHALSLIKPGSD